MYIHVEINILLNKHLVKEEIQREIRKYFDTNENKVYRMQKKVVVRGSS